MGYPIRDVVRPAVLKGQGNGELDAAILISIPGQAGGPTVRLVAPAARAWIAMCAAAKAAGITLKASGPADSYRSYEQQVSTFTSRYQLQPITTTSIREWRGHKWYLRRDQALAAVPGTSNHGWGLAVDTGDEQDGDPGTEALSDRALNWLLANAERFGFSWEVQSESWHLRYFRGDNPPAAVTGPAPTSTPTTAPGGSMFVLKRDGDPAMYLIGLPAGPLHFGQVLLGPLGVLPHVILPNTPEGAAAAQQVLAWATPRPATPTDAQMAQLAATIVHAVGTAAPAGGNAPLDPGVIQEIVVNALSQIRLTTTTS